MDDKSYKTADESSAQQTTPTTLEHRVDTSVPPSLTSHASSSQLSEVPLPDPNTREGLMIGMTSVVFTQDCKHFITGYNDRMGAMWNSETVYLEARVKY